MFHWTNRLKFAADFESLDKIQGYHCSVVLTDREAMSGMAGRLHRAFHVSQAHFSCEALLKGIGKVRFAIISL